MENKPSLNQIQHWMHQALIFPRQTHAAETEQIVNPSTRLSSQQRLGIYQRSYYARILKCMEQQFPALCHALGGNLFCDFAVEYLQDQPPERHTLYDLGRRFPAYLEEDRPDQEEAEGQKEPWIDFMVDLAHYERQLFVMFDAPGHEGKPFAGPDVPDHALALQPCFDLGRYRFPVARYYHLVRAGKKPALPDMQPSLLAMVRVNYQTRIIPLSDPQYIFLKAMSRGARVDDALGQVALSLGQSSTDMKQSWHGENSIRHRWIKTGLFITREH